jgi:hypothetical protein
MKNIQNPKKHHFVPICYLKNFIQDGNLYTLDVEKLKNGIPHFVRRSKPAGICYIEDYYKIPKDVHNPQFKLDGLDDFFVESKLLTILEERYSKQLYPKLATGKTMSQQDAVDLCDFILQLKLRNPFHFRSMEKKMPDTVKEVLEKIAARELPTRFAHIPQPILEMVIEYVKQDAINNPLFSKQMQLSRFVEEAKDPQKRQRLRDALISAKWWLYEAPSNGPFFITSDNPGFAIGRDGLNYNTKFTDGFVFHFPISPRQCLVITDAGKETVLQDNNIWTIEKFDIDSGAVIQINNRAIQQVNKLLIAADEDYLQQISLINQKNNSK